MLTDIREKQKKMIKKTSPLLIILVLYIFITLTDALKVSWWMSFIVSYCYIIQFVCIVGLNFKQKVEILIKTHKTFKMCCGFHSISLLGVKKCELKVQNCE